MGSGHKSQLQGSQAFSQHCALHHPAVAAPGTPLPDLGASAHQALLSIALDIPGVNDLSQQGD
eukprot:4143727-Lingulodinium_polyedra.AAC.1